MTRLSDQPFDVLVIGGGASGAATAREACLRGLNTALVERDDFGGGASAHCFKVVHGGIRYLQHADFKRMRGSCFERAVLLRIAPHLVSPLPFAIPTYGWGKSSKWFLGTGMLLYDAITRDCNAHVLDPSRRIGGTRFLGRDQTVELFPHVSSRGLSGAAVFEDGQMYNPPRLVLGFVQAAAEIGATVANYVEAQDLLLEGSRVIGVRARCKLTGESFDIRSRVVINAAGPWAEGLLRAPATRLQPGTYSRDACFLIGRKPRADMALALQGTTQDADALLARKARHLFMVPWRDCTLVGVWHSVVPRDPDGVRLPVAELRDFVEEINLSCPQMQIDLGEVKIAGFGLVPFGDASKQVESRLSFGKQSRIIDHRRTHGVSGLLSTISVRYTVARMDAAKALDLASEQLPNCRETTESTTRCLPGGDFESFSTLVAQLEQRRPPWLPRSGLDGLARNYGSRALQVLALADREPPARQCLTGTTVSHAEILYTLRNEMPQYMADVVFRRTDLGTTGHPGEAALAELQSLLQRELQWSAARSAAESRLLQSHFDRYLIRAA